MPYIPHTERDISRILKAVGATSLEDILGSLPAGLRVRGPLNLPKGLSEQELKSLLKGLGEKNTTVEECSSFLGAGAYNHYIPSVVPALVSRSEFYTSYTPYQPELSQGTLQAVFEYQTLVCQLTAMDVSNASLYDGASATAEAVLMARRITGKHGVVLSSALHPEYRDTIKTYLKGSGDHISEVMHCTEEGRTLPEALANAVNDTTACVVVQHPNFFGSLEDVGELAGVIHEKKGLLIVVTNETVSLGLLKPPGELGADIAVGDNQSFGNPVSYGGPYLGFMATKTEYIRQMPGRIVGQTVDKNGQTAYCLTFATREQHIRREKATSNICTNHGLCALAASVHMVSLGSKGLKNLAHLNLSKAEYLKARLAEAGVKPAFTSPTFNEFTVKVGKDPDAVLKTLLKKRIMGGLSLKNFYPALSSHILVAATELNSKEEIDRFAVEVTKA
ncbi:MAG TPA: aminomethyl-transferring glycine dehydrogenase subunit GcvPA [Thermodesulfobacteriota bacterium]|nr:aminomethyl-transferring glycine dehydrogenase subunit GcvPA [Thermodesulfobacteriota bacterium]